MHSCANNQCVLFDGVIVMAIFGCAGWHQKWQPWRRKEGTTSSVTSGL